MHGLLADINVQGHLPYLSRLIHALEVWPLLAELNITFATFSDLALHAATSERVVWNFCQQNRWILFTDNRNDDGPDSLAATLADSWRAGHLPVVTLTSKDRREHSPKFARRVAVQVAELLFDAFHGLSCDQPRIFVPQTAD